MQNVTPFPKQTIITKQQKVKKKPNKLQPFSYIKMTIAIVIGNIITLLGLFLVFLIFLNLTSSIID